MRGRLPVAIAPNSLPLTIPLKSHHKEAVYVLTMWPGAQRATLGLQITVRFEV